VKTEIAAYAIGIAIGIRRAPNWRLQFEVLEVPSDTGLALFNAGPRATQAVWLTRCWEKDTRYYEAQLHQDLWGGWVLTHIWGHRGTRLGRVWHLPCGSYAEGFGRLTEIEQRRGPRGTTARRKAVIPSRLS
jgi:hypothetical protein